MSARICVMPGDGIGREVISAAVRVLTQLTLPLQIEYAEVGFDCYLKTGTALPELSLEKAAAADAVLFGAVASPTGGAPGYRSPILELRREFDLFANLRPQLSRSGLDTAADVDMLIVRENTEGLYVRRERCEGDVVIAERVISKSACTRIARTALEHAAQRRGRLTVVHKANVLVQSDGLFRACVLDEAQMFPEVTVSEMLVDNAAYQMVRDPSQFDVVVTTNLYGDILSDLAAGLTGGLGLAASANIGNHTGLFEPVHGSAPDIAGRGIANPVAAIGAVGLMLRFLGEDEAALRLEGAVNSFLAGRQTTRDLGGSLDTRRATDLIIEQLMRDEPVGVALGGCGG